jgi:hypothetical protein
LATRRTTPPQPQRANLTVEQMRRGIGRLKLRITDLEAFHPQSVQQRWAPEVKALQTSIEQTLAAVFGHNTVDYNRYRAAARLDNSPIDATPDFLAVRNSSLGWGSENVDFHRPHPALDQRFRTQRRRFCVYTSSTAMPSAVPIRANE